MTTAQVAADCGQMIFRPSCIGWVAEWCGCVIATSVSVGILCFVASAWSVRVENSLALIESVSND
jgi:hypothetical protein